MLRRSKTSSPNESRMSATNTNMDGKNCGQVLTEFSLSSLADWIAILRLSTRRPSCHALRRRRTLCSMRLIYSVCDRNSLSSFVSMLSCSIFFLSCSFSPPPLAPLSSASPSSKKFAVTPIRLFDVYFAKMCARLSRHVVKSAGKPSRSFCHRLIRSSLMIPIDLLLLAVVLVVRARCTSDLCVCALCCDCVIVVMVLVLVSVLKGSDNGSVNDNGSRNGSDNGSAVVALNGSCNGSEEGRSVPVEEVACVDLLVLPASSIRAE
mmetsp:Transcript_34036/g.55480  ORF Transcript_34036/g.55480 Transcript_34036/m.55480 type:complete len:264 (-) Transcript_34036:120-911(-)